MDILSVLQLPILQHTASLPLHPSCQNNLKTFLTNLALYFSGNLRRLAKKVIKIDIKLQSMENRHYDHAVTRPSTTLFSTSEFGCYAHNVIPNRSIVGARLKISL